LMLDSLPERAQDPIVSGRNLTLAAARISAASASVIQSAAAGIGGQSPPEPDEPPEPDDPDEPPESDEREPDEPDSDEREPEEPEESEPDDEPEPEPEPDPDDPSPDDDDDEDEDPEPSAPEDDPSEPLEAFVPLDPPRSFFAQPDPLKWIVGGANSFRIVPSLPHDGQNCGPGSLRPWRMSVRWSQAVQAYS
jgi:outer membrane biosynthesis protein TonB